MPALGGFRFIANPYTIIIIAIIVLVTIFRRQVSETLGGVGSNLGIFGQGINTFVSAVASPRISPTIGLNLEGIFKDTQNYLFNRSALETGTTYDQPSGQSGGFNALQSVAQSTPSGSPKQAYTYSNGKWYSNI